MSGKIINLCDTLDALKTKPEWFRETYRKPVVYHRDCLMNFKLVKDEKRFAGGITWFCKNCNCEVFSYEEFIKEHDCFVVFALYCNTGCGKRWYMDQLEVYIIPLYQEFGLIPTDDLIQDLVNWVNIYAKLLHCGA